MLMIEPGGGRRSVARASVAATLRTAWAAVVLGGPSSCAAAVIVGFGLPASAASKNAFCAAARTSLRPGLMSPAWAEIWAGGQTGGRTGAAMSSSARQIEHG